MQEANDKSSQTPLRGFTAGITTAIGMFSLAFSVGLLVPEEACYPDKLGEALRVAFSFTVVFCWLPILVGGYFSRSTCTCEKKEHEA